MPNSAVSSMGCLKHQGDLSLGSWCPAPTPKERPATAAPCLETPNTGKARSPPGGRSLHGLSFPWVSGKNPASGSLSIWRSRLPPQSFLPVGIGEATPLVTSFDFFDIVSLHSLSYLWVTGRRCRYLLVLTSSISSSSTVFPTCGYRGGDVADNLH